MAYGLSKCRRFNISRTKPRAGGRAYRRYRTEKTPGFDNEPPDGAPDKQGTALAQGEEQGHGHDPSVLRNRLEYEGDP